MSRTNVASQLGFYTAQTQKTTRGYAGICTTDVWPAKVQCGSMRQFLIASSTDLLLLIPYGAARSGSSQAWGLCPNTYIPRVPQFQHFLSWQADLRDHG